MRKNETICDFCNKPVKSPIKIDEEEYHVICAYKRIKENINDYENEYNEDLKDKKGEYDVNVDDREQAWIDAQENFKDAQEEFKEAKKEYKEGKEFDLKQYNEELKNIKEEFNNTTEKDKKLLKNLAKKYPEEIMAEAL